MAGEAIVIANNDGNGRWRAFPWIVGIAIGALAGGTLVQAFRAKGRDLSIASLVAAVNGSETRAVEPRVSGGFAWAPFQGASRGGETDLSLASVVGSTLARTRTSAERAARHTAGVAQLLAGRPRDALATLTKAAESTNDPRVWSDLAAASYAVSARYDAPELLANALAAADTALALDANLPEALFNRALVLERLGLVDDAREAWTRYLLHDSDGGWAAEGREHLRRVPPFRSFKETLTQNYERFARDSAAVRELARQEREDARIEGAIEVLGRWAAAQARGDRLDAEKHLGIARELGSEIRRLNGDRMLERSVAVIDAADAPTLATLASAHLDYTRGIRTFWDNKAIEAAPMLNRAADGLARARSPLTLMARYYAANTVFDQGRREEARTLLEGVLADTSDELPACRAHVLSQIGACHFTRTAWGDSIRALEASSAIFERLGEASNTAAVRRLMSIIYDQNGDRERAWKYRMASLRGLGRQSNLRLEKLISSIAQDAMLRQNWRTASAFLSLEIGIARRIGDDVHLAETLLFRAAVRHRLNDAQGAQADLTEGRTATAGVKDDAYRAHLEANGLAVRAMLTPVPSEAQALLTDAIAFESAKGDRKDVPRLLLQRARARRAGGDPAGAAADLDRGIAELETERASLPTGAARWGAFHSAEELFDDAIDLAIDNGDVAKAFSVVEKARARTLLESYGRPSAFDPRDLPRGTLVIEYVALPSRLIIFTADDTGIAATAVPARGDAIEAAVDGLARALQSNSAGAKRAAAALWQQLVEPVSARVGSATTLAFVPDAATASAPFSALVDAQGQYLIETHAVVVAPSASVFAATARRHDVRVRRRSVLIVANSRPGEETGALTFVAAETERVARAYATSVRLQDDAAQFDALSKGASAAEVIHFSGHAIGDDSGLEPASIVLRQDGAERRIGVSAISALTLRHDCVVVLAGCNTARGERRGTEGVISVAHGFLSAGAPSVIAALWPIDDEASAAVFPRLHALLAQGLSPADALREIQIESIHRGDVPASLWAALRVIGS